MCRSIQRAKKRCETMARWAPSQHHFVPFRCDDLGFAALVHAVEPPRVVVPLSQLFLANAVVLAYFHPHAATRTRIAIPWNDDCFAVPSFRLVLLLSRLLSRRFCGLRIIEPSRRAVALEPLLFIHDVAHAAIPHAPLSIGAAPVHLASHVAHSSCAPERANKNRPRKGGREASGRQG